jgi:two-component system chemotaxis sensor kinase CheA
MADKESAILKEFLLESLEGISSISEELTHFEKEGSTNNDLINSIYRAVHTLKGSASFLAFKKLEELAHATETVLDHFREGTLNPSGEMIDLLLASFDRCQDILKHIEKTGTEPEKSNRELADRLESLLEHELLDEVHQMSDNVVDYPGEAVSVESQTATKQRAEEVVSVVADEKATATKKKETTEEEVPMSMQKSVTDSTVRVNVNLLDKILNVVGELVLNRNQILQLSKETEEPVLNRLSHQLNVITTELQTDIMTTRMQPVSAVFSKFERIVRDLARGQGKKVRLEMQGQETELDKTLLEYIKDPMTHLIRNAIDHGLESPESRVSKGKSEIGNLSIKTYHAGGQVIIEIRDDGNGVNVARVLDIAISKGIMTAEEAQTCPTQKAINLIFHPGFSTAEKVTNISGRGVGMDVVKSNIEKIGGQCDIQSVEGNGTTFKLKIPLTLAIIPALIVKGSDETFAIPQKNLIELVLLEEDGLSEIEKIHESEFFRLRGDLIPIFRISESLYLEPKIETDNRLNIVVLQSELGMYGLIVDEILDTQEIVVKPLSHILKTGNVYAGATIMGDGTVALILDALGLFNKVDSGEPPDNTMFDNDFNSSSPDQNKYDAEEMLLFKLEDEREYGIPLGMVSRLEEFCQEDIEMSGTQRLIRYRDTAMPLILLNKEITYDSKNKIKKDITVNITDEDKKECPCIVSTIQGRNYGFIVDQIMDIGKSESAIDYSNSSSEKLMGTTYVHDNIITIIDIHKIIEGLNLGHEKLIAEDTYKAKILLVEDSILYQRLIQDALETSGYEVTLAVNGRVGHDILESGKGDFDLVVTDIEMPEMNGFDLVKNIRKFDNKYRKIPVIAVTTRVSESDIKKGKEAGIDRQLKKLDKDQVIGAVNDMLTTTV